MLQIGAHEVEGKRLVGSTAEQQVLDPVSWVEVKLQSMGYTGDDASLRNQTGQGANNPELAGVLRRTQVANEEATSHTVPRCG
jgi:hypothetical protein